MFYIIKYCSIFLLREIIQVENPVVSTVFIARLILRRNKPVTLTAIIPSIVQADSILHADEQTTDNHNQDTYDSYIFTYLRAS